MTVQDTRETLSAIPRPRTPQHDTPVEPPPVGEFPWPEPWRYSRGALPRSEYWDVTSASWHSRGPIPLPRLI